MKILIAEDDPVSRRLLEALLVQWGYEVEAVGDGQAAWEALEADEALGLAVLDWMMPELDGVEVCRRVRALGRPRPTYILLLTAKHEKEDVVAAFGAGVDDFVVKPFEPEELRARVRVGERVSRLQAAMVDRVEELQDALRQIKTLRGLLPICSYCKKIRDDQNYWERLEEYIGRHSDAQFSHSVCPECYEKHVKPQIDRLKEQQEAREKENEP